MFNPTDPNTFLWDKSYMPPEKDIISPQEPQSMLGASVLSSILLDLNILHLKS